MLYIFFYAWVINAKHLSTLTCYWTCSCCVLLYIYRTLHTSIRYNNKSLSIFHLRQTPPETKPNTQTQVTTNSPPPPRQATQKLFALIHITAKNTAVASWTLGNLNYLELIFFKVKQFNRLSFKYALTSKQQTHLKMQCSLYNARTHASSQDFKNGCFYKNAITVQLKYS